MYRKIERKYVQMIWKRKWSVNELLLKKIIHMEIYTANWQTKLKLLRLDKYFKSEFSNDFVANSEIFD